MPFDVKFQNDLLELILDTPNCAVNIFDRPTATQLLDILARVRSSNTTAVVFRMPNQAASSTV